jgi:hypothetical protein
MPIWRWPRESSIPLIHLVILNPSCVSIRSRGGAPCSTGSGPPFVSSIRIVCFACSLAPGRVHQAGHEAGSHPAQGQGSTTWPLPGTAAASARSPCRRSRPSAKSAIPEPLRRRRLASAPRRHARQLRTAAAPPGAAAAQVRFHHGAGRAGRRRSRDRPGLEPSKRSGLGTPEAVVPHQVMQGNRPTNVLLPVARYLGGYSLTAQLPVAVRGTSAASP